MPTTTSRDGTTIAYSTLGSGPALLLVDGALCSREFGPMPGYAKALADSFTVYWYDRRGRGGSGDTPSYAVAREVEDLAAMVQVAGGSPFVFGTSSGAALGLQGLVAGLPIRKLLMYEAPYTPVPAGGKTAAQHAEALWELVRRNERGAAVRYFMCDVVGMPKPVGYLFALFPMWPKLKAVAHTLPYDLSILADVDVLGARAQGVRAPVMVAGGSKSPEALQKAVTRVAAAIPGSTLHWVDGQTHDLKAAPAAALARTFFLPA
ncbi:MAG TPA: alpha/beta hydrolase [Gemmatimonadales bacterium]|nr:alpha/beta hydrolase [Gemmatimonadales bacterium]